MKRRICIVSIQAKCAVLKRDILMDREKRELFLNSDCLRHADADLLRLSMMLRDDQTDRRDKAAHGVESCLPRMGSRLLFRSRIWVLGFK